MTIGTPPRGRTAAVVVPGVPVAPVVPSTSRLRPLGLGEVTITAGPWAESQARNAEATLPHIGHWLEKAGWLANFDRVAAGGPIAGRTGREFADSEVYKYLEALSWEFGRTGDATIDTRIREVTARIAPAQDADGYVSTAFGREGQPARYSDLEWGHELYCMGHLIQAAVARLRTGVRDGLVEMAVRAADHVCAEFGPRGRDGICGHAEIEVALAELGRALDEPRYLDQALLFVDRHGHGTLREIEWGPAYFQDDVPVREAHALRGHAVRAGYLAAAAVDVAVERGDGELYDAVRRQWAHTLARRTYITGGMGSRHQDEAFGEDFMLPADGAYSETCAGIASIMVAWRLLLSDGGTREADHIERALYNVVATSVADDGRGFFYTNTLHQRSPGEASDPETVSPRAHSSARAPWFEVSCCPPNVARTLASLASLLATKDEHGIQIHQYAPSRIATTLPDGEAMELEVTTDYPRSGEVRVRILRAPARPAVLTLRVPGWARGARLADGAELRDVAPGAVRIERAFLPGTEIVLELPVAPRFSEPDPRIDAVRGTVAVERGPLVYCLESVDLPGGRTVDDITVDTAVPLREGADGEVLASGGLRGIQERAWPYPGLSSEDPVPARQPVSLRLHPYQQWGERGLTTMRVWLPRS